MREYNRDLDGEYDFEDEKVILSESRVERTARRLPISDARDSDALAAVAKCESLKRDVCSGMLAKDVFLKRCREIEMCFRDKYRIWKYQVPIVQAFYETV